MMHRRARPRRLFENPIEHLGSIPGHTLRRPGMFDRLGASIAQVKTELAPRSWPPTAKSSWAGRRARGGGPGPLAAAVRPRARRRGPVPGCCGPRLAQPGLTANAPKPARMAHDDRVSRLPRSSGQNPKARRARRRRGAPRAGRRDQDPRYSPNDASGAESLRTPWPSSRRRRVRSSPCTTRAGSRSEKSPRRWGYPSGQSRAGSTRDWNSCGGRLS